jgi:hypothetical protein
MLHGVPDSGCQQEWLGRSTSVEGVALIPSTNMNRTSGECHTEDNWQRMADQAEAAPQCQSLEICLMADRKHAGRQLNRED